MAAAGELEFYREQSWVTEPGSAGSEIAALTADLGHLKEVTHGLVVHYRAERPLEHGVAPGRMAEIDLRYAAAMFARLVELGDGRLLGERVPARRLVGCCRDFTVLFVAMARALGVPARARVGFASYFLTGMYLDHVVAEVWDERAGCWKLVDAQLRKGHVGALRQQDGSFRECKVDPLDVPRNGFLVGGEAWRACRAGQAGPEGFLVGPDVDVAMTRGWPYLAHNVVHHLAALNRDEMLLWDSWGVLETFGPSGPGPATAELIDEVAEVTAGASPNFSQLREFYTREHGLRAPGAITSYDPLGGPPRKVALAMSGSPGP